MLKQLETDVNDWQAKDTAAYNKQQRVESLEASPEYRQGLGRSLGNMRKEANSDKAKADDLRRKLQSRVSYLMDFGDRDSVLNVAQVETLDRLDNRMFDYRH